MLEIKKALLERAAENAFQNKDACLASALYNEIEGVRIGAVRVDISDYENSHMKKPKGSGEWGFSMGKNPRDSSFDITKDYVFWVRKAMTYSEALKQAKEEASKRKVSVLYVLA